LNSGKWNRRLLVLLLIVLIPLAVALMFSLRGFVREVILVPLSLLFWLADLLIRSTPQVLFWGVLLVICLIIAVRSLYAAREPVVDQMSDVELRLTRRQRVGFWIFQMQMLRQGVARARFADFLSRLGLEVLAFREQVTPAEAEVRLQKGELLAPEIVDFLRLRRMVPSEGTGLFSRMVMWFETWRSRILGLRDGKQAAAMEDELRRAVEYLEDQLEVKNDVWTNHSD
jgi:hypothetical protein